MTTRQLSMKALAILLVILVPLIKSLCLSQQTDTTRNYATNGDFQNPYLGPNSWRFTTDQLYGWSSTKIEQGTGSIYNPAWGSATQVIQMDTDINEMYNQTLVLPYSKFSIKVSYAARNGAPLATSGLRIWWNGQVIRNIPTSLDYNIHTETFIVQAKQGNNYLILQGAGVSDGVGMTCDNIVFNKIQSYNRVQVNGQCLCDVGYFDDMMNWSCQPCTMMDTQCRECSYDPISSANSSSANSSNASALYMFTCEVCGEGYFSQGGACVPCQLAIAGCYNCSMDGSECMDCNETQNYFLQTISTYNNTNAINASNTTYGSCILCSLDNCLTCSSLSSCIQCNTTNNHFLNQTTALCQPCTLTGCLLCTNLTICVLCDNTTYYLADSNATQCSFCDSRLNMFIQPGTGLCQRCAIVGCRVCGDLQFCTSCISGLYLLNESMLCQPCAIQGCLMCLTRTTCLTCDAANEYNVDDATGSCIKCLSCSCRSGGRVQNKAVPGIVYSEEECSTRQDLQRLGTFIGVASYIIMFFAIISVKIVGLELFGVLQLAFFNLADNKFVNLYLSPLLGWKYLNGFNLDLTNIQNSVPENVQAIKYNNSFISNINIMFLILIIQFMIALSLILLSRKFPIFEKISKFLFHEVFLTLFLFNSFNIAFSAGLHFKYATSQNTQHYILSSLAAVLGLAFYLIILIVLQTAKEGEFGEFKNKFKKDCVNQVYIFVSVLYRMGLGVYMAVSNEQTYGTLLILAFSLIYIMYNIINLPFCDFYQNYRANLCHITQLIILLVTNYYQSMRYNDELESKARIYAPAKLELVMIVVCVVVSGVCLVYEIYLLLKGKMIKKKIVTSGESFHNLTMEQMPVAR